MKKKDMQMLGFEIVAYSGDARTEFIKAIESYEKGDYISAKHFCDEGEDSLLEAHKSQMSMLQMEAQGKDLPYSLTMVHAQDHLMSCVLLRDVLQILLKNK